MYLTAWRYDDDLFIVWEAYPLYGKPDIELLWFNYCAFVNNYRQAFEAIADKYETEFVWKPSQEGGV